MTRQEVIFGIKAIYDGDRISDTVQHYTPNEGEEINVIILRKN